jgi:hypothetical protein
MTQCRYLEPLASFELDKVPDPWYEVNIVQEGKAALQQVNDHLGENRLPLLSALRPLSQSERQTVDKRQ